MKLFESDVRRGAARAIVVPIAMQGTAVRAAASAVHPSGDRDLAASACDAPTQARLSVVTTTRRHAARRRVLVVDDHHDSADTLEALLAFDGHAVAVAYEGAGVVALVERFRPDVIILDLELPDVSGYEVARRLRAIRDRPMLVALTGYGGEQYRTEAREAGFEHHLLKPVDVDALRVILGSGHIPVSEDLAVA